MVQIGKTYGNLVSTLRLVFRRVLLTTFFFQMVDLRVSNEKLRARGRRLVRHICGTTVYVPQEVPDFVPNAGVVLSPMISLADVFLDALISYCGSSVKLAIAVGKTGLTREAATKRLLESDGLLDTVLVPERSLPDGSKAAQGPYFLCVDGGGTSTRAFISTPGRGVIASAKISRPCNVSHCGIEASVASIRAAINLALVSASPPLLSTVSFDRVWIGAAGVDPSARPAQADLFREVVLSGLKSAHQHRSRQTDQSLWVSSDAHLVGSSLLSSKCRRGVVLIAGTGSVAVLLERRQLSYSEPNSDFPFVERRRAGGLGYLLGDEGSAYSIGREALRFALSSESRGQEDEPFRQSIMGHFGVVTIGNLVSAVYDASSLSALDGGSATVKSRIADLSPLVLDVAFPRTDQSFTPSSAAIQIVSSAISALIVLVRSVLHAADTDDTALAITGGLFRDEFFRRGFTKELEEQGMCFGEFVFVEEPGRDAGGWFAEDAVYRLSK